MNDDGEALDLLARILGRGRTSRLSRALVDTGMALDASAHNWGTRDPGLFQVVANVRPGVATGAVRDELVRVLEALAASGPTSEELERAQAQIGVARAFGREGSHALAQRLGELEAVGSWRLDDRYLERIAAVTPERIRAVAETYLHEDNRTVGMLVAGTPKTFDFVPFAPVHQQGDAPAAVAPQPLPEPRRSTRTTFAGRIAGARLPSGLRWKYVVAPGTSTIHVRGLIEAGTAFSPDRPTLPSIVAEMLARGTQTRSRLEIEARLERSGIRRSYHADGERTGGYDPLAFRFSAACVESELEAMLFTIAEELREPAFDPAELDLVKAELTGGLRVMRNDTAWRAMQRFSQLVYPEGDPHYEHDLDALLADIEATTIEDVKRYHAARLLAAAPIVSAAGGASERRFAALLEESLGSLPAGTVAPALPATQPRAIADLREDVALERKANVDIVMGRATSLVRSSPDFLAASIANGMLGRSTLSSRLGLRLREREGLTYGVTSAFLSPSRLPGPWRVALGVNPANVDRAIALVRVVLREFIEDAEGEREIAQQRSAMAGSHDVALATCGGIAAVLERMTYHGLPENHVDTYREELNAVSAAEIRAAAAVYLGDRDLIAVAAGTFAA
jgi:zinc protease